MQDYTKRLAMAIPGGAHTYSRGDDQYPSNAPPILKRGSGAYVYDAGNNEFLDYGMGLRAVNIGYAEKEINQAAIEQIEYGNCLTRASVVELEAAELLIDLIDSVEMVKFTKNGSTAVSAAVKLSRAFTGRDLIARCSDHPFLSYDDWFIGSTPLTLGVPENIIQQTKTFKYNDIKSLEDLVSAYPDQLACIILEPSTTEHPAPSITHPNETYLHDVKRLCAKNGIVFVLDEMITGFRWHTKGAQYYYNIEPDLCTFGKAMANGFSIAAVAGKREIMQLGSIDTVGAERLFLLSTTHGAEMCGLGAFIETIKFVKNNNVINHLWDYGNQFINLLNEKARSCGLEQNFKASGIPCSPTYTTYDSNGEISLEYRTLFSQELIKNKVLMPWVALSYRHGKNELERTAEAVENSLKVYAQAIDNGSVDKFLEGDSIKPVFRRFN